jgi:hypothetical protein
MSPLKIILLLVVVLLGVSFIFLSIFVCLFLHNFFLAIQGLKKNAILKTSLFWPLAIMNKEYFTVEGWASLIRSKVILKYIVYDFILFLVCILVMVIFRAPGFS